MAYEFDEFPVGFDFAGAMKPRKRRHSANHDEVRTGRQKCKCTHTKAEHEVHPDTHCYKCKCAEFKRKY